jgi:hypothetical protein
MMLVYFKIQAMSVYVHRKSKHMKEYKQLGTRRPRVRPRRHRIGPTLPECYLKSTPFASLLSDAWWYKFMGLQPAYLVH